MQLTFYLYNYYANSLPHIKSAYVLVNSRIYCIDYNDNEEDKGKKNKTKQKKEKY